MNKVIYPESEDSQQSFAISVSVHLQYTDQGYAAKVNNGVTIERERAATSFNS